MNTVFRYCPTSKLSTLVPPATRPMVCTRRAFVRKPSGRTRRIDSVASPTHTHTHIAATFFTYGRCRFVSRSPADFVEKRVRTPTTSVRFRKIPSDGDTALVNRPRRCRPLISSTLFGPFRGTISDNSFRRVVTLRTRRLPASLLA